LQTLKNTKSDVIVLDSISVIISDNVNGTAGSISQVKEVAEKIVDFGKSTNTTIVII
jgi:predicted ATP-dependent serine protease